MNVLDPIEVIRQKLLDLYGFQYEEKSHAVVIRNVKKAADALDVPGGIDGFADWLTRPGIEQEDLFALASHFTVGETYFFRERPAYQFFKTTILPEIKALALRKGDVFKIWSAGCSSGEEPYSLAMILHEAFYGSDNPPVRIVATDLNPKALQKAQSGVYTSWSFRTTTPEIQKQFFVPQGNEFVLSKAIRKMVSFKPLNLISDSYPYENQLNGSGGCDLIFCRNVLMYFAPEVIHKIVARLYKLLNPGGWLITSQVELNDQYFGRFNRIQEHDGVFYQKPVTDKAAALTKINDLVPKSEQDATHIPQKRKRSEIKHNAKATAPSPFMKEVRKSIRAGRKEHEIMAWQMIQEGSHEECIHYCSEILRSGNFIPEIAYPLAKALANAGESDKALDVSEQLIALNQISPDYYFLRASILTEKGLWQEAITDLRKVLYLDHKHIAARFSMVMLLNKLKQNTLLNKEITHLLGVLAAFGPTEPIPAMDGVTTAEIKEWLYQIEAVNDER